MTEAVTVKHYDHIITDLDGVLFYPDKNLENIAQDRFLRFLNERGIQSITLDTLRGLSLWNERSDFMQQLKLQVGQGYIIGCNGAFGYNVGNNDIFYDTPGLSPDLLRRIVHFPQLEELLDVTNQNDSWAISDCCLPADLMSLVQINDRVLWDTGFPRSEKIFKVAIDLPRDQTSRRFLTRFYKWLDEGGFLQEVSLNVSEGLLEITQSNYDKFYGIKQLSENGILTPGMNVLVLGDEPLKGDRRLLQESRYEHKGVWFESVTNYPVDNPYVHRGVELKNVLFSNFMRLLAGL
ncbi:HAD hydrolase family protein [Candidatus Dojkabacteria bacterium]|nr:HAD hydrolase family protein [Candidatus Dojkabacteria bacterium]